MSFAQVGVTVATISIFYGIGPYLFIGIFGPYLGHDDLPEGVVLSVPLTFVAGEWSVLSDVTVSEDLKKRLQLSADEIKRFCLDLKEIKAENTT